MVRRGHVAPASQPALKPPFAGEIASACASLQRQFLGADVKSAPIFLTRHRRTRLARRMERLENRSPGEPMPTTNLYTFVDLFSRSVVAAKHLLAKGSGHAGARGVTEQEMLGWRLAEDMHPLAFQLMVVANFSRTWSARVAGLEPPEGIAADLDVAGFDAGLNAALSYLRALKPEQFEGRDEVTLTFEIMPAWPPPCQRRGG